MGIHMPVRPPRTHRVALALAAIIVAGCCAGSTPTHYGCGIDNDGPAWPIVDGKAVIPPGTRSVPDYAFYQCTSLVSVTIPNSVTSIGDSAFFASSLVSVEIPASVASIGSYAFYYCTSLVSVTIPASVTSIGDAFHNCGCSASMYAAGATVCDCAASLKWPCTPLEPRACAGLELAECSVTSGRGLGMCCELEVHDCVCVAQGTAAEIAGICGGLKNGGIDCDQCKASPRCNRQLDLAAE